MLAGLVALAGLGITPGVLPAAAVTPTISVDDNTTGTGTNQFDYTGAWSLSTEAGYFGDTHHYSNSTSAKATVRFTGTQIALHGGTGSGAGIANVSVDGGPAYEVDFYSGTTAKDVQLWVSPSLGAGAHTLVITPAGIKNDAASSTFVVPDRVVIYDSADTVDDRVLGSGQKQFQYTGTWGTNGNPGYWSNTHSYSNATGATATFRFTGAAVHLYGGVGPSAGIGAVSIDGGPETLVDFYAASAGGNKLLWKSSPLAAGSHTMVLRVTGTKNAASSGTYVVPDRADIMTEVVALALPTTTTATSTGWAKFSRNPVLGKNYGTAFDISVLRENGIYRMWFSWRPQQSIGYVESVDGVNWTAPIKVLQPTTTYWEGNLNRPNVIRTPDGTYRMWYTGQTNDNSWIGYATSPDGLTWTRQSADPVLSPTTTWEHTSVMNPSVIYDTATSTYKMWYSGGEQYEPNAIGYATSSNGLTWSKNTGNPIFEKNPAKTWEQDRVAGVQVLKQDDGYYYMFYIGYADIDTAAIGIARSTNGITGWTRMPTNPIIQREPGWECNAVYKPYAVWEAEANRWKLWYNGRCAPEQVGLAVHPGLSLGF